MRISLLGGVRVVTDGGELVDIGSAKSQTVLAALALSPGTPLAVSRLVELVWGDAPPRTAHKTLQWHVAQLRKGLGFGAIVRVGVAYRLDVAPDGVDVRAFSGTSATVTSAGPSHSGAELPWPVWTRPASRRRSPV